jgi:hypothetical protein
LNWSIAPGEQGEIKTHRSEIKDEMAKAGIEIGADNSVEISDDHGRHESGPQGATACDVANDKGNQTDRSGEHVILPAIARGAWHVFNFSNFFSTNQQKACVATHAIGQYHRQYPID